MATGKLVQALKQDGDAAETRRRARRRGRRAWVGLTLLSAAIGGAGCFIQQADDTDGSGEDISAGPDIATALKSTLILADGCTAAKVGPRHLVTAARCVSGKAAFAPGQTITFKPAAGATQNPPTLTASTTTPDTGTTDPSADPDAGDGTTGDDDDDSTLTVPDAATAAPGTPPSPKAKTTKKNTSTKQGTVEQVIVHPSYTDKCGTTPCAFGTGAGSDAHDIAVIVLDAELVNVPTIPVDLDTVGPGDPVVMLGSGCSRFDSTSTSSMKGANTVAAAPKSAGHKGSPYAGDTTKLSTLDTSYVVTPGPGWADQTAASVCQNDVGAPLFRGTSAIAVAGVMANYTVFDPAKVLPVTVEHTRVDTTSKIGAWLTAQGVTTTHSCSGSCTKNTFDGGIPSPDGTKSTNASNGATAPGDASADALAAGDSGKKDSGSKSSSNNDNTADQPTGQVPLPPTPDESPPGPNDGGDVDGGPTKAAKKTGGCSAAPGESPSGSGLALGFGLAALAVVARRRRRS